jgi:ketosteroid isomerase-like protein
LRRLAIGPGEVFKTCQHEQHAWLEDRDQLVAALAGVMREYELATNTHIVENVLPFIAENASYWFSDGSHRGRDEIRAAIDATFRAIHDERYVIDGVTWLVVGTDAPVCRYRFSWSGTVAGEARAGTGRGTNVLVWADGRWLILHEQLTSDS